MTWRRPKIIPGYMNLKFSGEVQPGNGSFGINSLYMIVENIRIERTQRKRVMGKYEYWGISTL